MGFSDDYLIDLSEICDAMPTNVFWTDKQGKYLGCNRKTVGLANIIEVKHPQDIINKTIYDILPYDYADPIFKNDQNIIRFGKEQTIEEKAFSGKESPVIFLSTKMPLYDGNGEVTGLIGASVDITKHQKIIDFFKQIVKLSDFTLKNIQSNKCDKYISLVEFVNDAELKRFHLLGEYENIYLSKREAECVLNASLGKTAKETAKILNLSHRTVEFYLNRIKVKLKCRTITELLGRLMPFLMRI